MNHVSGNGMDVFSKKFLDALLEGRDLNGILDIGFELMGNPIFVTDTINKVLAYTKNVEVEDPDWNEIVEKGYVSFNVATNKKVKAVMEQIAISGTPVIEYLEDKELSILRAVIRSENKTIGHLVVPGNFKSHSQKDIDNAILLCKILSLAMQKNRYACNSMDLMAEYFLTELLDGKIKSTNIIREEMRFLRLELKAFLYILVIRAKDHYDNVSSIEVMEAIKAIFRGSISAVYNDDIVLFLNGNKKIEDCGEEQDKLAKLLGGSKLHGGLSRCFHSLSDVPHYYSQAVNAIELGHPMDRQITLYHYDHYVLHHMVAVCAKQMGIRDFCHPSLLVLKKYDGKNGTDFMQSLYQYLKHNKNLIETANALHIHRNTMSYRIKKIEELMDVDLNDTNLSFYLFMSFKILEFIRIQELDQS